MTWKLIRNKGYIMKVLLLAVSVAVASSTVMAAGPGTGKEVSFNNYAAYQNMDVQGDKDNKSVILQSNDVGTTVTVMQGELGVFDGNRSVVDIRLNSPGNNNDVMIDQSGGYSFNDSKVKIGGTTGGADIDVTQDGHANDSVVNFRHDEDNSTVTVAQTGVDNWSRVRSRGASKGNTVAVTQNGENQDSEIRLSGSSSNNMVTVMQGKNTSKKNNVSIVELSASSSNNDLLINQKGNNNLSEAYLVASSGGDIDVIQTAQDSSYISQVNSLNTTVYVHQN
jgi:hypothetical protein